MKKSNIQFLRDGRKVLVLDELNPKEVIVQEIYVVDGKEVPHGNRFTVMCSQLVGAKEPMSYLAQRKIELEIQLKRAQAQYEEEDARLSELLNVRHKALAEQAKYLGKVDLGKLQHAFEEAVGLLTGAMKYVMVKHYGVPELFDFADYACKMMQVDSSYSRIRFEGFKLITLYGMTEGDPQWRLNHYRDGSGSTGPVLSFYPDRESAVAVLAAGIEEACKDFYSDDALDQIEKWGLTPVTFKLNARVARMRDTFNAEAIKDQERRQVSAEKISEFAAKWLTPR
jgi:hypothetical protein